jgi:hypothetical protein
MKAPPKQFTDEQGRILTEEFIQGSDGASPSE